MKNKKILVSLIITIILLIALAVLFYIGDRNYIILVGIVTAFSFIITITTIINNRDEASIYSSNLKKILKTYEAILSKIKDLPEIEDRNLLKLNTIDDLINAQAEIRKPIFYIEEQDSCLFMLLDDKEMLVFVLRKNSESKNQIDDWVDFKEKKKKQNIVKDSDILDEIDKTTIIKLNNSKSFKVSPIREKKDVKVDSKEEVKKVKDNKQEAELLDEEKKDDEKKKDKKVESNNIQELKIEPVVKELKIEPIIKDSEAEQVI